MDAELELKALETRFKGFGDDRAPLQDTPDLSEAVPHGGGLLTVSVASDSDDDREQTISAAESPRSAMYSETSETKEGSAKSRPRLVVALSGGGKSGLAFQVSARESPEPSWATVLTSLTSQAGALLALRDLGLLAEAKVVSSVRSWPELGLESGSGAGGVC